MTFCPVIISCTKPSVRATYFCASRKYRAEPPPMRLATTAIATMPSTSTSVSHTEKYSIIANTVSTMAADWMSEGNAWDISWRSVSMSLV